MASLAQSFGASEHGSIFSVVGTAVAKFFDTLLVARSRRETINCLTELSDAQLADIGLTRENIAKDVYRDTVYL